MTNTRPNLKYTTDHEWILIEGDVATVGITDHAQEALGDLVFIELPDDGAMFDVGDHFAVVESVKAASEVYMPFAGEVIETNEELEDNPELVNESPYDEGWIVKFKITDRGDIDDCMDEGAYVAFVDGLN